jgi:hypothetical protein
VLKEKHKLRGSTPFPLMSKGENYKQSCRKRRRVVEMGRIANKGGELQT